MTVHYHEGKFPPDNLDWERISSPLTDATNLLARYDSYLERIPDPNIMLSPMLVAEATTSSRIEGTRATMSDVLRYDAGIIDENPETRNGVREIVNYRDAVHTAEQMLEELPLTGRTLCAAHEVLLKDVRGNMSSPGTYRKFQNYIGIPSQPIEDARYMPPHPDLVPIAMKRWEQYVNLGTVPTLVKTAVAHAEFESIHPFGDGNGRIGRIIIPLMLQMGNAITRPCFYMSEFFEHRNNDYQDRLLAVSESNAWTEWCVFFLEAVALQAAENNYRARSIYDLFEETRDFVMRTIRADGASNVAPIMFRKAIFPASIFTREAHLNESTARRLIAALKDENIVIEVVPHSGNSPAVLAFPALINLVERTVC